MVGEFFCTLRGITQLSDKQVRDIALKVLRNNAVFAHREHVIIAKLGDEKQTGERYCCG